EDLLKDTPSCEKCPKRAGNAKLEDEAYKEIRADMCLDPSCYKSKEEAHHQLAINAAKKAGSTVLSKSSSAGYFSSWGEHPISYDAPFVEPTQICSEDPKRRTYKQLLNGHLKPEHYTMAVDPAGRSRPLIAKSVAAKLVRENHPMIQARASTPNRSKP